VGTDAYWRQPFKWNRDAAKLGERHRVFCASLSDWLEDHPAWLEPRARLMSTIRQTEDLDWLLLTKRVGNFNHLLRSSIEVIERVLSGEKEFPSKLTAPIATHRMVTNWLHGKAPDNVWIGVSVENEETAWERIPVLQNTTARIRFLSVEPLLENVDLGDLFGISWLIVGGESGPKARPCNITWIRSIIQQCQSAGVPCFVKQLGSRPFEWNGEGVRYDDHTYFKVFDPKGGEPDEWPTDLCVREFPEGSS
jgi:protein gp37